MTKNPNNSSFLRDCEIAEGMRSADLPPSVVNAIQSSGKYVGACAGGALAGAYQGSLNKGGYAGAKKGAVQGCAMGVAQQSGSECIILPAQVNYNDPFLAKYGLEGVLEALNRGGISELNFCLQDPEIQQIGDAISQNTDLS